jgi:hypothetical protein
MGIISTQACTFRLVADGTQLDIFQDEDILISNNVTGLLSEITTNASSVPIPNPNL